MKSGKTSLEGQKEAMAGFYQPHRKVPTPHETVIDRKPIAIAVQI